MARTDPERSSGLGKVAAGLVGQGLSIYESIKPGLEAERERPDDGRGQPARGAAPRPPRP